MSWVAGALAELEAQDRRRSLHALAPHGRHVELAGRRLLNACGNDYLGLATHPAVRAAAAEAATRWGVGAGASRLVAGTAPHHEALEAELAALKGQEAALLTSSGMLANLGAIPALAGKGDLVVSDERNHASIVDGCRLAKAAGAVVVVAPHADPAAVAGVLEREARPGRRMLVVTDGVFSMDGDLAPLRELQRACVAHGAALYVDDAHGTGVLGATGAGTSEHLGVTGIAHQMGTLSKALGGEGGFVATDGATREWLVNRCRTFFFSTAPSHPVVAAARAGLAVVREEPGLRARLATAGSRLRRGLRQLGYDVPDGVTPILPVLIGQERPTMRLMDELRAEGVWAAGIRPPTVPEGSCRIRVTARADFTDEDVAFLLEAFARAGRRAGVLA